MISLAGSSSLSFDDQRSHDLTVLAQNSNTECQRARSRVNLQVLSNRIRFEGDIDPVSIFENAQVDDVVATISASGGVGEIQYTIVDGSEGTFAIDSSTGVITVIGMLDYETTMEYSLTIRAESTGSTAVTGMATQMVNILDVNESPYFVTACANSNSGCSFTIAENLPSTSPLGSIIAMDPDLPTSANGMLTYRFDNLASMPPFMIDSNGAITTTASLNREDREVYVLTLLVSDQCTPTCSISIQTTVVVTVTDVNDNVPAFIQGPTMVQVEENSASGSLVAQYIAEDQDSGTNADIIYSLTTSGGNTVPFSLHAQTGVLTVSGTIDYEVVQSYSVTITASNPDGTETSVATTIEVLNLNDNSPIFSQDPYTMSIVEHSTMDTITISATDADLGTNGEVRYFIIDGNFQSSFSVGSSTGVISIVGDIDRETIASFNLTVRARDRGVPRQRDIAHVIITITDINDNSPNFLNAPYMTQVREDVGIPFNILQVVAFDMDERGNPNSEIVYSITGGNTGGAFAIDESTGQIQAVQSLDFETIPSYTLDLMASDQGDPVMTDTTTVTINLINVNEDPPMISGSQAVEISEFAALNSVVAVFDALDPDNNAVTFGISSGNSENKFDIETSSGRITLIASLDYEMTSSYMLEIIASDGVQSTSANLTVTVLDENEFAPVFSGGTAFSVNEEEPANTLVGTVMATDADGDPANNQVTFSFVQQTSHFTIGSTTGEIRTVGTLDRETLIQVFVPPASQLRLDVTARDSASPSRQTTTSITITLQDINDNSPIFADSMYENSLLENRPAQTIFRVSASDIDLGPNSQIAYSFSLNVHAEDTSLFTIDADTGVISTTGSLDCEKQSNYSFTITATDMGTPAQSSTVQGFLSLLDENDNAPIFSMNVYEKDVSEDLLTMQSLVQVLATDADKDMNGHVRYSIMNTADVNDVIETSADAITLFTIDETSGVVMHLTPFNYESLRQVNVTVKAFDLGLPRRSSMATITFNVLNVDERRPEFFSVSCDAFIVEDMPPSSFVTNCEAVDLDSVAEPGQIDVTYAIISGNEDGVFEIEANTGVVRNSVVIDSDVENIYTIVIEATDLANRAVRRTINIFVRDINDNAPVFDSDTYSYHFTDLAITNRVQNIVTVRATDQDNGFNGTVRYSLPQESVTRVSDKETVVVIIATDLGTPPLSTNTTLTVTFDTDCLLQEFVIDAVSGQVQAFVLCQVTISPASLNTSLGSSNSGFLCNIVYNSRLTYQWIHNSSLITPPTLIGVGRTDISYTLLNAQFDSAGEYACKATSRAGSLQTVSRRVTIQSNLKQCLMIALYNIIYCIPYAGLTMHVFQYCMPMFCNMVAIYMQTSVYSYHVNNTCMYVCSHFIDSSTGLLILISYVDFMCCIILQLVTMQSQ